MIISGCTFEENISPTMIIRINEGIANLIDSEFKNNRVEEKGVIFLSESNIVIENCQFLNTSEFQFAIYHFLLFY